MKRVAGLFFVFSVFLFVSLFLASQFYGGILYQKSEEAFGDKKIEAEPIPPLDTLAYDAKLLELANNPPPPPPITKVTKDPDTGEEKTMIIESEPIHHLWPVKTVYPNRGAILPFSRVVAYYGNLYSTKMGVLGQYPEEEVLARLQMEVDRWRVADPGTPVKPALHYIAVVAQVGPGPDGKYRIRMPGSEIDKVLNMARKIDAVVFLDVQVGFSNLETELPLLEKYLKMPQVHLGVDPEFSMKSGIRPGKVVGTLDAADINFAAGYLAKIARENNLTPKILVVHRYTGKMLTSHELIRPRPEVQIVIHMDGWGEKEKKIGTYRSFIYPEPVQFTGFKLFYKSDTLKEGSELLSPEEILQLRPRPIYIQYQ